MGERYRDRKKRKWERETQRERERKWERGIETERKENGREGKVILEG